MRMTNDDDRPPEDENTSAPEALADAQRRRWLGAGVGGAAALWLSAMAGCTAVGRLVGSGGSLLGFQAVPPSVADAVTVPEGYVAKVVAAWGDPVGIAGAMPAWKPDASNSAAEQALQMGMHHDGLAYFPLDGSRRGLLVVNHEYTDDGLLHPGGQTAWTLDKVRKAQAAVGISVIEVELTAAGWRVLRPSKYARRLTASTPLALGGPAAGHAMMKTAADPAGRTVAGTLANCAGSATPWGTFLSGEEWWSNHFTAADTPTADERRYGIRKATWYRWPEVDERFDTVRHPNEPHRFGWIVEVDPTDPAGKPVKRTALGRGTHEGAFVAVTKNRRAVVYSGEDTAFEYIYKFVSRDAIRAASPGVSAAKANATLLDHGTLYVARFDAGGKGRWLPLVHGQGPLTAAKGFDDQGELLIRKRQASDLLGATPMDRPEWLAVDQKNGWVYCTLTNNAARGTAGKPGIDAANPRANNTMGQIIRWKEDGDFDGETFVWNHLLLAGDPANARAEARGNIQGDPFSSPDTIAFDTRGVLWIGTDISSRLLNQGEMARLGNNALMACDLDSGEVRRFLTGPVGCEITGATWTPDGCTMFIDIQHPGETPGERSDPAAPRKVSNWPDFNPAGRPRSATVVIRRVDGGVIGS